MTPMTRLKARLIRWALAEIAALYQRDASYGELAAYGVEDLSYNEVHKELSIITRMEAR